MAAPDNSPAGGIKALLPTLIPLMSVLVTILGVAISFTKVQMESSLHGAQITSLEGRLDRFQNAFDTLRAESAKDNRDRDRLIERAAATNEAQNARLEQLILALRRMDDMYRMPNARPQSFVPFLDLDTLPTPPSPLRDTLKETQDAKLRRRQELRKDVAVYSTP